MHPIIQGFFIGFLIAMPTGPVGFLCVKRALTHNFRASIVSVFGSITADLIFGLVAIFGLTSVMHFFTHEQNTIRFFGGLLLLYIGIKTYFDISHSFIPRLSKYEHLGNFASTFSLTITNPIQILTLPIVFTAIGTGVSPGKYGQALVFLVGIFIGSVLCWSILIGTASLLKKHLKEHHFRIINRVTGGIIVATGAVILGTVLLSHLK